MTVITVLKRPSMCGPSTQALLGFILPVMHCHTPVDLAPSVKIAVVKELWAP